MNVAMLMKTFYRMAVNNFANLNTQTRIKSRNTVKIGSVNRQKFWPASVCSPVLSRNWMH